MSKSADDQGTRLDGGVQLQTPEKPQADNTLTVRKLMAKARAMTGDVEESAALHSLGQEESAWRSMSAVLAPYDPESLLRYVQITPHLKPCIDSLAQNVDGYGYKSEPREPWMDSPNEEEVLASITEALEVERWVAEEERALAVEEETTEIEQKLAELRVKGATARTIRRYQRRLDVLRKAEPEPTPEPNDEQPIAEPMVDEQEVLEEQARQVLDRIHLQLRREKFLFNAFFEHCVSDRSFVELRKAFRIDLESHGWGTIEWLRDRFGRLKRLAYVPAYTVRPVADIGEFVLVEEDDAVTPLSEGRTVMVSRRFQIYVQQVSGERVYFKSVGDPRTVSRSTGQVYASIKDMQAPTDATPHGEGPNAIPANELMWVSKHDPTTPCAPPDWIGNLLVVLGVREADETNFFYLSNNAIPSGLLFVHGGTVPRQTKERLEHRMTHEVRGARNSGKILVVEARPGGRTVPGEKSMQPALTFQSLREAQTNDALFTMYDQRSADRIGASFRLSPMLRGYTPTSLNRATAYASLAFAEQQVFAPPRQAFDWMVNKFILPEIGVRLLKFVSNSPPTTSTEELSAFISATAPHGTYMPSELREIASGALNKELVRLEEDWVKRPLPLTLSGMTGNGAPSAEEGSSMSEIAARLRQIEMSVAQIVTEELRSIGLDYEVQARHVDENVVATDGAETNGTETE